MCPLDASDRDVWGAGGPPEPRCLVGLFVGGKSTRMGGVPKGTLLAPDGRRSIVERLREELFSAELTHLVLVGASADYGHLSLPALSDKGSGKGPIAGMFALAEYAVQQSFDTVLAVACDMPYVERRLLRRLVTEQPQADALVPRRQYWEPLCARYRAQALLTVVTRQVELGRHRLNDLVSAFGDGAVKMSLTQGEEQLLRDWDDPSDLPPSSKTT